MDTVDSTGVDITFDCVGVIAIAIVSVGIFEELHYNDGEVIILGMHLAINQITGVVKNIYNKINTFELLL